MASQFSSSNPFRKSAAIPKAPDVIQEKAAPISAHSSHSSNTDLPRISSKPVKKVRVQSPPPPSSTAIPIAQRPSIPIPTRAVVDDPQVDPFEIAETQEPELKGHPHAPPNPFAKTLETFAFEPAEALSPSTSVNVQPAQGSGRASLDVDAFKRLLMTGHSGRTSSGTPPHPSFHSIIPDGTSDNSSVSRQSIFESIQESHVESPRTSHELSEQENERYSSVHGRKKPPPPSSRHGKLIKMELRDDPAQMKDPSRPSSSSSRVSQQLSYQSSSPQTRSQTDLNKPLPAAPRRISNELNHDDRESIFDKEAAGKIPEPPSPTSSITRKMPPPPPITRRHSQLVSKSRSRNEGRLSPRVEEEIQSPVLPHSGRERSSSNSSLAPVPPPARRPGSLRSPSIVPPISSPSTTSVDNLVTSPRVAPPPPPSRSLSARKLNRPPSVISIESQKEPQKRSAGPPPPPTRHKSSSRNSLDNPVLSPMTVSSENSFRRSEDSSRRASDVLEHRETTESKDKFAPEGSDILADLAALQREVEAAMARKG